MATSFCGSHVYHKNSFPRRNLLEEIRHSTRWFGGSWRLIFTEGCGCCGIPLLATLVHCAVVAKSLNDRLRGTMNAARNNRLILESKKLCDLARQMRKESDEL